MSNTLSSDRHLASFHNLRFGVAEDAPAMAALAAKQGEDPDRIAEECGRVLREPFGFSVVATTSTDGSEKIVGFINIPVLRPSFAEKLRCGELPFRSLAFDPGQRFIANEAEVGRQNAGSGHDLFVIHSYRDSELSPKEDERLLAFLVAGLVERFVGNNVRAILQEVKGMEQARLAEPGGYAVLETFDDWYRSSAETEAARPILIEGNRTLALRSHNFHMLRLVDYEVPILRLPPAAREVIRYAYWGYSDNRIVRELSLTPASLNSRWTRILDIAEAKMPSLFVAGKSGRSRDRHPLLTYLRNHPEEMWPYEPAKE